MGTSVFIVGAGFSLSANRHYGLCDNTHVAKRYPLAPELGVECFGPSWKSSGDIEAAFGDAMQQGNKEPIKKLVKLIQTADYFLGQAEANDPQSVYRRLVRHFTGALFVSFNYDSLLEQILFRCKLWNPNDGFGVTVKTGNLPTDPQEQPSKVTVLHLHGSVLLYPEEFSFQPGEPGDNSLSMTRKQEPEFRFDPHNLTNCFYPLQRACPGLDYTRPEERVIAPVPNKSSTVEESYVKSYIQRVYCRAIEFLREAERVIAIGYRFATCDRTSFDPLLRVVEQHRKPLWIVALDASDISTKLQTEYPGLRVNKVESTLDQWAESGFSRPLLGHAAKTAP